MDIASLRRYKQYGTFRISSNPAKTMSGTLTSAPQNEPV
jgi:hypothetical protein